MNTSLRLCVSTSCRLRLLQGRRHIQYSTLHIAGVQRRLHLSAFPLLSNERWLATPLAHKDVQAAHSCQQQRAGITTHTC